MNGTVLVLDTMLLVLYIVGSTRRDLIEKHKRLQAYTVADFDLLLMLITEATQVIVTPNTLTETSNLLKHIKDPDRTLLREAFRKFVGVAEEEFVPSRDATSTLHFMLLGLADASLIQCTSQGRLLLTADSNLHQSALQSGVEAVNFNHLREDFGTV